jgi:hypothetical protein
MRPCLWMRDSFQKRKCILTRRRRTRTRPCIERLHSVAFVRSPLQSRQQAMDFACVTQSFQCGTIENRESWNKTFPQQVFSPAARSRYVPMREKEHAPELHSVPKHQVANIPDRNSDDKTSTPCGGRIWPGCFFVPKACSRSGISMGACREKVTSIASIKHRSNVSGKHRASAAVL